MSRSNAASLKSPPVSYVQESVWEGLCCALGGEHKRAAAANQSNQQNKPAPRSHGSFWGGAGVAVSTVLSDFHGSHNKTGLGDRGKTRVGKVLQTVGSSIGTAPGHFPALSPGSSGAPEAGRHREQPSTTAFSR